MTIILLIIFSVICLGLLFWGFKSTNNMYQYPFLAGAVFTGWVLPQLIGLSNNPLLPVYALDKTILMCILCALACFIGYKSCKQSLVSFNWSFSHKRLLIAAAILSILGSYFFFLISKIAPDVAADYGGGWTGIITVYVFLSYMLTVGLILSLVCYFHRPSFLPLIIIFYDFAFYFDRIVLQGRRQAMVELFIILCLSLWFFRRKIVPRYFMLIALLVGTFLINSIGNYRNAVMGDESEKFFAVTQIDFVGNLKSLLTEGGVELENAVYGIEAYDRSQKFDFGFSLWNEFVRAYVPGQFLGGEVKDSLMFDVPKVTELIFYRSNNEGGSTQTGMLDAFASFWYFGAIKFFIIGFIMAKFYSAAIKGHLVARIIIMLIFVGSLESITHGTGRFFMCFPRLILFLLPALLFAKIKKVTN